MRKIYFNGNIYTVTNGIVEAFVEEKGEFLYVGSNEEALSYNEGNSELIDLEGTFVTAGFNDSHMHVLGYGYSLQMIQLSECTSSLENLKRGIGNFIEGRELKENEWIRGRGWITIILQILKDFQLDMI